METQLTVNATPVNAFIALPPEGKGPGILVIHAWWGLTPFFKNFCTHLAAHGYVVLAPDLNNGKTAATIDEAKALMSRRDTALTSAIVTAAADFLLAHPACTSQKLGLIGFSMGAAWALVLASTSSEKVAATILFYGTEQVDFSRIKSPVLGHFSDVDNWEPLEGVRALENDLKAFGVDVTFHIYTGLGHWFFENDRPEFDPDSAAQAWERSLDFIRANL